MKKPMIIAIVVIVIAAAIFFVSKKKNNDAFTTSDTSTTTQPTTSTEPAQPQSGEPKVEIVDVVVGKGAEAVNGKSVTVHYTGTLKDGTKFDSSVDRKEPFTFSLGAGQVIKGWEEGIQGMKVGGKRKLTIPPEKAYGNNAVGAIPANSVLIFDVELLDVK
jgi:FKBP-type peptidyl-prolyl cis-trans isomerase